MAERRIVYCQQILKHGQLCDVLPKALQSGGCAFVDHFGSRLIMDLNTVCVLHSLVVSEMCYIL